MKAVDLFSGAGGLAKGLELAGFEHVALVEINKDACASLRLNFDPGIVYEGDIARFNFGRPGTVDMVTGGPPCQPFSLGGKHGSHTDSRDMFPYAIRCIEHLQPKAFLFENVKGLLRASFSGYFDYIILRLMYPHVTLKSGESWQEHRDRLKVLNPRSYDGLRYKVRFGLLNAADYGVPQKRERVFIIGTRSDLDAQWSFPAPSHSEDRLNWDKYVTGNYWQRHGLARRENPVLAAVLRRRYGLFPPETLPWRTVRDALVDVPQPQTCHGIPDHILREGARTYPGHTGSEIDQPAKTIKAGAHGVPGGENMIRHEDGTVRYFTTHEAKIIQTFPRDFRVVGAWGEAMRQIGNAVPVALAEAMARHLFALLGPAKGARWKDTARTTGPPVAGRESRVAGEPPAGVFFECDDRQVRPARPLYLRKPEAEVNLEARRKGPG